MIAIPGQRKEYFIVSFILLVAVIFGVVNYSADRQLRVNYEVSGEGVDPECAEPNRFTEFYNFLNHVPPP